MKNTLAFLYYDVGCIHYLCFRQVVVAAIDDLGFFVCQVSQCCCQSSTSFVMAGARDGSFSSKTRGEKETSCGW